MQRAIALLFMLAASGGAQASGKETPDMAPLSAPLPPTPEACAGAPALGGGDLRFVTLFGIIDWEGRATQVQVQEPSDDCLKEAGVEAVRQWRFAPVDPDEYGHADHGFRTTLIYPAGGAPRYEMSAKDGIKRYPPRFPDRCFRKAGPLEMVAVTFDVDAEGKTENIESVFSSYDCLTDSAIRSVKRWRYAPRLVDGRAYPRTGVYTEITYEIGKSRGVSLRRQVLKELISISSTLDRKLDPRIALEQIAMFERRFGDELIDSDKALLLRYRGSAKIDAMDYAGALEDLRAALALEEDETMANNIRTAIAQLEAALAAAGAENASVGDGE